MYLRNKRNKQKIIKKNRCTQIGCAENANFEVENEIGTINLLNDVTFFAISIYRKAGHNLHGHTG